MSERPLFVFQIGSVPDWVPAVLEDMGYQPIPVYPPVSRPLPVIITLAGERSPWLVRLIVGLRVALGRWK